MYHTHRVSDGFGVFFLADRRTGFKIASSVFIKYQDKIQDNKIMFTKFLKLTLSRFVINMQIKRKIILNCILSFLTVS